MTTTPPSGPSESTLESRLFDRLDVYMTEIKDALRMQDKKIDRQGEKIDRLSEEHVGREEYDALRRRVDAQATDVAVHSSRLTALETERNAEDTSRRQRPLSTWQLVLASVAVLTALFFDFIMATTSIITLVLLIKR